MDMVHEIVFMAGWLSQSNVLGAPAEPEEGQPAGAWRPTTDCQVFQVAFQSLTDSSNESFSLSLCIEGGRRQWLLVDSLFPLEDNCIYWPTKACWSLWDSTGRLQMAFLPKAGHELDTRLGNFVHRVVLFQVTVAETHTLNTGRCNRAAAYVDYLRDYPCGDSAEARPCFIDMFQPGRFQDFKLSLNVSEAISHMDVIVVTFDV
jgi:hypothetical protein